MAKYVLLDGSHCSPVTVKTLAGGAARSFVGGIALSTGLRDFHTCIHACEGISRGDIGSSVPAFERLEKLLEKIHADAPKSMALTMLFPHDACNWTRRVRPSLGRVRGAGLRGRQ